MSKTYGVALLLTLVLAGGYFYTLVEAVCKVPIDYRLGILDERFGLSLKEARLAIADAESVWEEATGRNLFNYNETAEFAVHFIFDERQQFAQAEENFREQLDAAEGQNEVINETYEELISRYEVLESEYKAKAAAYESRLAAYNAKVDSYNAAGGAPPTEFAALEEERRKLDREAGAVNSLSRQLNNLAKEINRLSEQGNQLVERYNEKVGTYNETFGESREFTQGDYQGDRINIYKFSDQIELKLVLAHELGHALSLGHVENSESILFDTMGGQPTPIQLSTEDLAEFERVCGSQRRSNAVQDLLQQILGQLQKLKSGLVN